MKNKIIIGNWKMNHDYNSINLFIEKLSNFLINDFKNKNIELGIAPPNPYFFLFKKINHPNFSLISQNICEHEKGSFTGEISSPMIKDFAIKKVIVGHSERRNHFLETNKNINNKIKHLLNNNLSPILCIGENLDQFEKKETEKILLKQIKDSLKDISINNHQIIIAYEPIWAIGSGKIPSLEYIEKICLFIKNIFKNDNISILYGGSVNANNIKNILKQKSVDGVLVGKSSLQFNEFKKMVLSY